ncbi:MAG TPA: glycerol-3-phosphate acyltransferase [Longimicrobiaceae bacterium]
MTLPAALLAAYLLGCLNAGYYVVRLRAGTDVRGQGSGSAGARNAGRVLGRGGFAAVFLLDCAKGAAALWMAAALGAGSAGMAAAMLAVVLGHVLPVQLGFRGGKGASTALGALLALDWRVAAAALLLCAALYAATRRAVPSGLVVFALLPAIAAAAGHPWPVTLAVAALSALLLAAHRDNVLEAVRSLRRPSPLPPEVPR